MFGKTVFSFGAVLAVATAQTGPGFPLPVTQSLGVRFESNTVSPAGELIQRPETVNPPNISTPVWVSASDNKNSTVPYGVLLMVDLDVPRNNTRVQLLHWLATNVTLGSNVAISNSTPLVVPDLPIPYLQPSPPLGDVPHMYNIVLFQQPANFSIPVQYSNLTNNRVFFNVSRFVRDAGLGQPLAGSYFQVQNLSGTPTTTYPPARSPTSISGDNGSSPTPFAGVAAQLISKRILWISIPTALLAGIAGFAF